MLLDVSTEKYNIEYIRKGYDKNKKKIIHCNAFISSVKRILGTNSIVLSDSADFPSIAIVLNENYDYNIAHNQAGYTILLDENGNERIEFSYKN